MDDHLLIAGLSGLCFKENVVAISCNSAMQCRGQVHGKGGGENVQLLAGRVQEAILRGWTNKSYVVTLIVPWTSIRVTGGPFSLWRMAQGMGGKVFWE